MRLGAKVLAIFLIAVTPFEAARLSPAADQAFQQYVDALETRLAKQHSPSASYVVVLQKPAEKRTDTERQLRSGVMRVEPVNEGSWQVSGGILHHWRGAAFIPGAKARDMLMLLRDYNGLHGHYAPEVQPCKVLVDEGDVARLVIRLKKQKIATVVLDAEYEIKTRLIANQGGYELSRSTHIWQVDDPGTEHERRREEGNDNGFLWRLNSYWSFLEAPGGLLIECEAVSLTRDIPLGVGWLITPILTELPRESLAFTLTATKKALLTNVKRDPNR